MILHVYFTCSDTRSCMHGDVYNTFSIQEITLNTIMQHHSAMHIHILSISVIVQHSFVRSNFALGNAWSLILTKNLSTQYYSQCVVVMQSKFIAVYHPNLPVKKSTSTVIAAADKIDPTMMPMMDTNRALDVSPCMCVCHRLWFNWESFIDIYI